MAKPTSKPEPIGLDRTLALLAETKNEAALAVLAPALESPHAHIQSGALQAILSRRSPVGQREVLRHLHRGGETWRNIIGDGRGKLTQALRDGVLGSDRQMCENACDAILWFREYDLMQSLVTAAEVEGNPNAPVVSKTLLALADLLYEQLTGPRDYNDRRDPQLVRAHVVTSLEKSVSKFSKHHVKATLTAFLMLSGRDNAVLKQILIDPMHPVYLPVVDELLHEARPAIWRMLLSFLDDPHAPTATIGVVARRTDRPFVQRLLRKIGCEPSAVAANNLKRVESIAFLRGDLQFLDQLDESCQHSAVKLLMASGVKRVEAFRIIEHLLLHGAPAGRRAAAEALVHFHGSEANAAALAALADEDPQVQATITAQLRARGIPGALNRLIELVDSKHEIVRDAAIESLGEFDYDRYVAAFDLLDEEVRKSTGKLVKKINAHAIASLAEDMKNQSRTKRMRAIAMAVAMDAVAELEESLLVLVKDEDHIVRAEAVAALGCRDTFAVRAVLREALYDRSVVVQETAERSLQQLALLAKKSFDVAAAQAQEAQR